MKRRTSRELALRAMYETDISKCDAKTAFEHAVETSDEIYIDSETKDFAFEIFNGTLENIQQVDTIVAGLAKDWAMDRLSPTDRSLLRIAVYEMSYMDDIPLAITIDETLEIAKKYCDYDTPKFINGIVGSYAEQLKKIKKS